MEKGSTLRERMALLTPEEEDAVLMTPTEIRKKNSVQTEKRKTTFHSLFMSQAVLCNLPVLILVLVASLDNADKQLMAASFPMIERALGLDVKTLGYFSLFTNLSYALSLPFWGYLVHKFGMPRVHILLAISCVSWGTATLGIALFGHSVLGQALFRSLNGAALGSIMPLSQTLLVDMVDVSMRGRAFGVMAICEKLAGTFATASIVYLDPHWEYPYWGLGFFSVFVGLIACQMLHPSYRALSSKNVKGDDHDESPEMTVKQIIQRIVQLPAFLCMVVQGVFGGTPWDMMSFLLLLMDWRGFTKNQIVTLQFTSGLASMIGHWLGGILGDYASQRSSSSSNCNGMLGRILLALVSVVGGIPLYALYLYATDFRWALLWFNCFQLCATWCQTGALRPICAEFARNPSERAQIVALWMVLEKASGAIFGAPLVGYLTSDMLSSSNSKGEEEGSSQEKAHALAWNLFLLSSLFWSICAFFWVLMAFSIQKNPNQITRK